MHNYNKVLFFIYTVRFTYDNKYSENERTLRKIYNSHINTLEKERHKKSTHAPLNLHAD